MRCAAVITFVVVLMGATGCGGMTQDEPTGASQARESRGQAARSPIIANPRCRAGSVSTTSAHGLATAAGVLRRVRVRRRPTDRAASIASLGLKNANGVRTVLGVLAARVDGDCRPTWYEVQVPIRPNGSTGWVRASDVTTFRVDTEILVDLSDRLVRVFRRGEVVLETPASIGHPRTPTPTGRYYVNQRLLAADSDGPYGPGGVGISAFSPVLVDWPQGGPIAIHGTNADWSIGMPASNGCLRIDNEQLSRMMEIVTEGTPVTIRQ